jgi:transposase
MSAEVVQRDISVWIGLRQQAAYWQAMHQRAVERETVLREEARQLRSQLLESRNKLSQLMAIIEAMKAKIVWFQRKVFGRQSEKSSSDNGVAPAGAAPPAAGAEAPTAGAEAAAAAGQTDASSSSAQHMRRRRGKQPGTRGCGRKVRASLPCEERVHELKGQDCCCKICGQPFGPCVGEEISQEIDWQVRICRIRHRRKRYARSCQCASAPRSVTAPVAAKVIPKGMFTVGFWSHLLVEKYLHQRPLYRIVEMLAMHGLNVSQGTLTGALKHLSALFEPLYLGLLEHSRQAGHWAMDETRWMVWGGGAGESRRWWLWVVVTRDTCVFVLDPTRSAQVPKAYLGEQPQGILNVDRYSAYKSLGPGIMLAFCWAHVRRDFLAVRNGYPKHQAWAGQWLEHIGELFALNARRRALAAQGGGEAFEAQQELVRASVERMKQRLDEQRAAGGAQSLEPPQRKVLDSMNNHWAGLTVFVAHAEAPMDNNEAERCLRNPIVGRKNYYGSGALWSGTLAAMLFSIFQTLRMHKLSPLAFLRSYLQACAQNGGQAPADAASFLPWNATAEQKAAWSLAPDAQEPAPHQANAP